MDPISHLNRSLDSHPCPAPSSPYSLPCPQLPSGWNCSGSSMVLPCQSTPEITALGRGENHKSALPPNILMWSLAGISISVGRSFYRIDYPCVKSSLVCPVKDRVLVHRQASQWGCSRDGGFHKKALAPCLVEKVKVLPSDEIPNQEKLCTLSWTQPT